MSEVIHMPITVKEARALEKLDLVWDSISTAIGLYQYLRILGPNRTRQLIEAVGKGQRVQMHVLKVMVCGRCGTRETVAPIKKGETVAIGEDPLYRCFACKVLEEAGL